MYVPSKPRTFSLKLLQAFGLIIRDNFLGKYNVSIDTSDVTDYMHKLITDWMHPNYYNFASFLDRIAIDMAEVITAWGFCYSFNIVDAAELYHLEK